MSKLAIVNKASRSLNKIGFKVKKHSPEILLGVGVVGVVTSTVMACKATRKLDGILDETKELIDTANERANKSKYIDENGEIKTYTEADSKNDIKIIYAQTGLKLVKLYAPAVTIGMVSLGSIVKGHHILTTRNAGLAAAYMTIDKSFKEYRANVVERFGEGLDRELRYNIKAKEIEEKTVDENGNEVVTKKVIEVPELSEHSQYAKFFDNTCIGYSDDPEYSLMFLRDQEEYANELLKKRGRIFLNDVYDMLGIQRTKAGQVVGWVYDENNPVGDNKISFGIYDMNSDANRRFVNGLEPVILLDFNVDGDIWSLM